MKPGFAPSSALRVSTGSPGPFDVAAFEACESTSSFRSSSAMRCSWRAIKGRSSASSALQSKANSSAPLKTERPISDVVIDAQSSFR